MDEYCHKCGGYCGIDHYHEEQYLHKIPRNKLIDFLFHRILELEAELEKQRTTSISNKIS